MNFKILLSIFIIASCSSNGKYTEENTRVVNRSIDKVSELDFAEAASNILKLKEQDDVVEFTIRINDKGGTEKTSASKEQVVEFFEQFVKMEEEVERLCNEKKFAEGAEAAATTGGDNTPRRSFVLKSIIQCLGSAHRAPEVTKLNVEKSHSSNIANKGYASRLPMMGYIELKCGEDQMNWIYPFEFATKCYTSKRIHELEKDLTVAHQKESEEIKRTNKEKDEKALVYEGSEQEYLDNWCNARNSLNYANNILGHEKAIERETGIVNKKKLYEMGNLKVTSQRWQSELEKKFQGKFGRPLPKTKCNP